MKQYKNMSNKEILNQIEWSDNNEFSYDYSLWAFNEIKRLNTIIETLNLYFKYMVDDRNIDEVSQLSDRAFNEYITLSVVEDYYKLVKEEPDEQLKELKKQIKKEECK